MSGENDRGTVWPARSPRLVISVLVGALAIVPIACSDPPIDSMPDPATVDVSGVSMRTLAECADLTISYSELLNATVAALPPGSDSTGTSVETTSRSVADPRNQATAALERLRTFSPPPAVDYALRFQADNAGQLSKLGGSDGRKANEIVVKWKNTACPASRPAGS